MLRDCTVNWGSVRKVRYLADIYSSAKYALENAESRFSPNTLRSYILTGRQHRLELIHKHYQSVLYTPVGNASSQTKQLQVTLPDTLAFLKIIGIFEIERGKVLPLPLAFRIEQVTKGSETKLALTEAVLRSKYPAYWCFLGVLNALGSLRIPRTSARRDKSLRQTLRKQGFLTDVASFYTLRDLFYELEAINWYIDFEGHETIYPVVSLTDDREKHGLWQYSISIDSSVLLYGRRVSMDAFVDTVIGSYLRLTKGRFDVEADLVSLRDDVCKELRISDEQFKELVRNTRFSSRGVMMRLSFGSLYHRKRNYAPKLVTLPEVSPSRLALYVRLQRKGAL